MKTDLKNLPSEIFDIFRIFNEETPGSVRLVGGCVRDLLLDREITDYDFATIFTPQKSVEIITKAGFKAIPTGIKYGTVTAIINKNSLEITTLRSDKNTNGRHPEAHFVEDYLEDAKRRDFTVNALYLDDKGQVYDYFNGLEDLNHLSIKFIGKAEERIKEDYLRILRFFRFTAIYGNKINKEGLTSCITNKSGLNILSSDRVRTELIKFFNSQNSDFLLQVLSMIENNDLRKELIPTEFNINGLGKILELEKLLEVEFSSRLLLFSVLFNGKTDLVKSFEKLNLSNADKKHFDILSSQINSLKEIPNQRKLQELSIDLEKEALQDLYLFLSSQYLSKNPNIDQIWQDLDFITTYEPPIFPVNGNDLISLGFKGVEIGKVLSKLKNQWVKSEFKMNKKDLLKKV